MLATVLRPLHVCSNAARAVASSAFALRQAGAVHGLGGGGGGPPLVGMTIVNQSPLHLVAGRRDQGAPVAVKLAQTPGVNPKTWKTGTTGRNGKTNHARSGVVPPNVLDAMTGPVGLNRRTKMS